MWLFRAVSPAELTDIVSQGEFRPDANTLAGKWFAETSDAARHWGRLLYANDAFHLVQVNVPDDVADDMFCLPNLDQIGPARYADGDVLARLNQQHQGIAEVPVVTGGP